MLKLGSQVIDFPFILAPMAGITNAPFRRLMREMGTGVVVSELISAAGIEYGGRKTHELCKYFDQERPVGLQIFGESAEHLEKGAQYVEKLGADFVDINLGCPVPKVVSKGGGAAMLKDPAKLFETLSRVKKAITIPLTVKIRTGWDACSLNAVEVVHAAAEAGVEWVAIHGRSRAQGYEGAADWDFIGDVKSKSPIPIIGNGDILTAEGAVHRLRTSGCDAVMIGRGALRNPFIFLEIEKILGRGDRSSEINYWALIQRHLVYLRECYNDFYLGVQLRKFLTWYSAGMEGASNLRRELYSSENNEAGAEKVAELARAFFDRPGLHKQTSYLNEAFLKGGHG